MCGEWVSSSFWVSAPTFSNLWVAQRSPARCHELVIYVRLNVYVRGLHSHSGLYPLLPAKLCQSVTIRLMEWSLSEQDELWPAKPKQDSRQGEAHNRHLAYRMCRIPTNTLFFNWILNRRKIKSVFSCCWRRIKARYDLPQRGQRDDSVAGKPRHLLKHGMKHCHPSEFSLSLTVSLLTLSISLSFWYQSDIALANQLLLWSLSVRTPGDSRLPFYLPDYWVFSEKRVIIWLTVILILVREKRRKRER